LDINTLSDISFANIFSHTVDSLFTLLCLRFSVWCNPICLFWVCCRCFQSYKSDQHYSSIKKLFPFVFSRNLIVLGVMFESLVHFEFIFFCIWCEIGVQVHSSACSYPVDQHNLLKDPLFVYCIFLTTVLKISWL
jgi:hypothetical protein